MLLKERLFIGLGLLTVVGGSIIYFATKPEPTRFRRSAPEPREPLVLPQLEHVVSDGSGEGDWVDKITRTDYKCWAQLLRNDGRSCASQFRKNSQVTPSSEEKVEVKEVEVVKK